MCLSANKTASLKVNDHPDLGLTEHYGYEEHDTPFAFRSLSESPSDRVPDTELTFNTRARIYSGQNCKVFRGDLTADDASIPPMDVVIKISLDNPAGLKREAAQYCTKLRDLQGQAVPFYYGVYQASGPLDSPNVTILVLEYCGNRMTTSFPETSTEFWYVSSISSLSSTALVSLLTVWLS